MRSIEHGTCSFPRISLAVAGSFIPVHEGLPGLLLCSYIFFLCVGNGMDMYEPKLSHVSFLITEQFIKMI